MTREATVSRGIETQTALTSEVSDPDKTENYELASTVLRGGLQVDVEGKAPWPSRAERDPGVCFHPWLL